ncbi:transcriptional regulator family: Fungal Specific TF [Penicillium roqueforti]|nr:transcriptional regulator family: Fungal Specific TF [Penicillium roqueforti]KAI2691143.1 transcriptional regulator family: Fungal Specific TF [Penicillium roqueforti]KAI2723514.1 transcriptional regulator family: Fungal Specific TF [Penicillium roqueforti]KAI3135784.1 transcriptional regulator family: Fungal Specific TF [Penicillium roqueforti]KAI3142774.1 transcriptional regulator family: Fungal Specific TF [Penicillium roqueforti]
MNLRKEAETQPQSPSASTRTSTPKSQASDSQSTPRRSSRKKSSDARDTKARRVRTGCLTCRQRHLKCDEAVGRCLNCRKSDRICRRGVRLNFIDTQTVAPPHIIARPHGSKVTFRDDSRLIASLYVGGFEIYPPVQPESPVQENQDSPHDFDFIGDDDLTNLFQSMAHSFDPLSFDIPHPNATDFVGSDTWHQSHLVPGDELLPHGTSNFARKLAGKHEYYPFLTDPEQVSLLRTFMEEVGPRLDIMDEMNHFSQILPGFAISEPILLKAFLACGARHLSIVDPSYGDEKATHYYDAATRDLLNAVHDPNRDSVLCATAALALGFSETMQSQSSHSGNHSAGSRALIRECGWNAKTPGLGGACFRISVGAELLNCMRYNWTLSWDPNTWGIDMDMDHPQAANGGNQDLWHHRILYIFARVMTFKASSRPSHGVARAIQLNDHEWITHNRWCDQWAKSIPRSLVPLGHLQPWQTSSKSVFPEVWLVNRSAIVSQLFYHATRIMLAKTHPFQSEFDEDMRKMQRSHAHEICGIIAYTTDRSVADISLYFLVLAAECLETREAQEEVLGIFDTITKVTCSSAEPIKNDLKQIWSWAEAHPHMVTPAQMHNHFYELDPSLSVSNHPDSSPSLHNPLLTRGDFSLESHPYQGYYVPPHHHHALNQYHYGSFDLI